MKNKRVTGGGNAIRYNFGRDSYLKFSYENAVRLPSRHELVGTGISEPNVQLKPETSHNVNLGYTVDNFTTKIGNFKANAMIFLRDITNLIQWSASAGRDSRNPEGTYKNLSNVKSEGVQGGFGWASIESLISTDFNATWMDFYNTNTGERIPNEPYYYANANIRLNWYDIFQEVDSITVSWNSRFVEEFSLVRENSADTPATSDRTSIPSQLSHSFGVNYSTDISDYTLNFSLEVQNVTDEKLYDFKGVQKPGRSYNAKIVLQL